MKFGKQIQGLALPGWSGYYLDYKALKKIINSLAHGQSSRAAQLAAGQRPPARTFDEIGDIDGLKDVPQNLQEQKAAFFFKLERELEKVNSFYLQKEAELRVRLRSLIDKKRLLQNRPGANNVRIGFSYTTLKEGFQHFEKDLNKLQQFIEINATGFRKILKKWDKRAKSNTKELYLSRQVEIQPCFNREVITELADKAAENLLDLENLQDGSTTSHNEQAEHVEFEKRLTFERQQELGPATDLESDLNRAILSGHVANVEEILRAIPSLSSEDARLIVSRLVWRNIADAQNDILDLIIRDPIFDFHYVDDINEQTILHQAAMAGKVAVVRECIQNGCSKDRADVYGRRPLHYATMQGHEKVTQALLQDPSDATALDLESYTPLLYAVANGHAEIVKILLDAEVDTDPVNPTDLIPLSLACQYGHTRIVDLLLTRGAKIVRNAEGLFPLHLAAREGHAAVCKLLTDYGSDVDAIDKYTRWTPLFQAASEGHASCVKQLLAAHANIHALDENQHTSIFHAAWEGHIDCVNLLLAAGAKSEGRKIAERTATFAPVGAAKPGDEPTDLELDAIPSLSLPPPIIPFRIYGHNYLDKKCHVQISLGHRSAKKDVAKAPVLLYGQSRPSSLKLVIIPKSHSKHRRGDTSTQSAGGSFANESVPFSIILPLADEQELFSFQIEGVDTLTIEFEVLPTFGSKLIGKATALPQIFANDQSRGRHVVPLISHRLKVIGELAFDIEVVKPFGGVQLEIGGRVETYWKSTNLLSGQEANIGSAASFVTASSLSGEYIRVVLQVTKDHVPVAYPDWILPCADFDAGVCDLTFKQFAAIASRMGRTLLQVSISQDTAAAWQGRAGSALCSFAELLATIPPQYGLEVELRYPTASDRQRHDMTGVSDINTFVDSVLATLYKHSQSQQPKRSRGIIFSSFNPSICTTINWKQPNYAVFFKSYCGLSRSAAADGKMLPANRVEEDRRCLSIRGAVDFAKQTHLLGIVVDSTILVQIPSLISSIKEAGLVLTTFGLANEDPHSLQIQEAYGVDALVQSGVILHRQKIDLP